jgi:hypothetical protein
MPQIALWRRLLAEFVGTALLVTAVVGSGIMATTLSPHDVGLQLLENSVATAFALGALILTFGPVSGAHFNPVVSTADWFLGRRTRTGLTGAGLAGYTASQIIGAMAGSVLANVMFNLDPVTSPIRTAAHPSMDRRGRRDRRATDADLRAGPSRQCSLRRRGERHQIGLLDPVRRSDIDQPSARPRERQKIRHMIPRHPARAVAKPKRLRQHLHQVPGEVQRQQQTSLRLVR